MNPLENLKKKVLGKKEEDKKPSVGKSTNKRKVYKTLPDNFTAYMWQRREPGLADDECEGEAKYLHTSLSKAVLSTLPDFQDYGLTAEKAALLLLNLGLITESSVAVCRQCKKKPGFVDNICDECYSSE